MSDTLPTKEEKCQEGGVEEETDPAEPTEEDYQIWLKVKNLYEKANKVVYTDGTKSFAAALRCLQHPKAREFHIAFGYIITDIMLEQHANTIKPTWKDWALSIITDSLKASIILLKDGCSEVLENIAEIFNPSRVFYSPKRWNDIHARGCPELRDAMIDLGLSMGVVEALIALAENQEISMADLPHLLAALSRLRSVEGVEIPDKVVGDVCEKMMGIVAVTDGELKKQSTKSVKKMIKTVRAMGEEEDSGLGPLKSNKFWMGVCWRYIKAGSLRERLFGWDELKKLVEVLNMETATKSADHQQSVEMVVEWLTTNNVLEEVLGDRVHREIVSRAKPILAFLARRGLSAENIAFLWKSFLGKRDELKDEIESLLLEVVSMMNSRMLAVLFEVVDKSLTSDGEVAMGERILSSRMLQDGLDATLSLLGSISKDGIVQGKLLARKQAAVEGLATVFWHLGSLVDCSCMEKAMENLFEEVLRLPAVSELRGQFLESAVRVLESSAVAEAVDESAVTHALKMLLFALQCTVTCGYDSMAATEYDTLIQGRVLQLNEEHRLLELSLAEIQRCLGRFSGTEGDLRAAIEARLFLIGYICGHNETLKLPAATVSALYQLMQSVGSSDIFFSWLSTQCVYNEEEDCFAILTEEVLEQLFDEILCVSDREVVKVRAAGCWDCFRVMFLAVNSAKGALQISERFVSGRRVEEMRVGAAFLGTTAHLPQIRSLGELKGFDALWQLALFSQAAKEARGFLLKLHANVLEASSKTTNSFFGKCLDALKEGIDNASDGDVGVVRSFRRDARQICSAISLLHGYVLSATDNEEMTLAHGNCGRGDDLRLSIAPRRQKATTGMHSMMMQDRIEYLDPFLIHTHTNASVGALKEQISAKLDVKPAFVRLLFDRKFLLRTAQPLSSLGMSNDDEVTVVIATKEHQQLASSGDPHPGDVLASTPDAMEMLFNVLVVCTEAAPRDAAWNLLQAIPTDAALKESLLNISTEAVSWDKFLKIKDIARTVYSLQVVRSLLVPANAADAERAHQWREAFIASEGFHRVLEFFLFQPDLPHHGVERLLPILNCCLFGKDEELDLASLEGVDLAELVTHLLRVVVKQQTNPDPSGVKITEDCLKTTQAMLRVMDPSVRSKVEEKLMSLPEFPTLVTDVLLSGASEEGRSRLRDMLLELCVSEPCAAEVRQLLAGVIIRLPVELETVTQAVDLLCGLLTAARADACLPLCKTLVETLTAKLLEYPRGSETGVDGTLVQSMRLLRHLLLSFPSLMDVVPPKFETMIFSRFLFSMPSIENTAAWPVCRQKVTRAETFKLLEGLAELSPSVMQVLMEQAKDFVGTRADGLRLEWGYAPNFEVKTSCKFVGLRNQGCTCYMNSLIQQLFMNPTIRRGILSCTPPSPPELPEQDEDQEIPQAEELVGKRIALRWVGVLLVSYFDFLVAQKSGHHYNAEVVKFNKETGEHELKYDDGLDATFVIAEGRPYKETGKVALLPDAPTEEEATNEVMRQLKRTFRFLHDSELRAFDPRPLVESCRCLRLEYSVFQQNDASEFCDKLLDKVEVGLKGTENMKMLDEAFSGQYVYQKIPKECPHRSSSSQKFLQVELGIRNRTNVVESLNSFIEGELMDGDNKVLCDICNEKKATLRRQCFGHLPNLLCLHLKRFDLDYETFQTVKINSKLEFPVELNMKPYTQEGIALKEQCEAENRPLPMDQFAEDPDYSYVLVGVLIHTGVAQGGHYYSIIKDRESGQWYKFDDDDVTPFEEADIKYHAFGGVQERSYRSWSGTGMVTRTMQHESMRNALMLFYERVTPRIPPTVEETAEEDAPTEAKEADGPVGGASTPPPAPEGALPELPALTPLLTRQKSVELQQTDANALEVWDNNNKFIRDAYIFDVSFHRFLASTLRLHKSDAKEGLAITQLGTEFMMDVLIHAKKKQALPTWVELMKERFAASPAARAWLLERLLDAETGPRWLKGVLLESERESSAREEFNRLLVHVLSVSAADLGCTGAVREVLLQIVELLWDAAPRWRYFDEYFGLLRDLCEASAAVRKFLIAEAGLIPKLVHFILGAKSPFVEEFPKVPSMKSAYSTITPNFTPLVETIGAMAGIPRMKREPLLVSSGDVGTTLFNPKAEAAFQSIFEKFQKDGGMGHNEIVEYFKSCGATGPTSVGKQRIDQELASFETDERNRWTLNGFLGFYKHAANRAPTAVWKDLKTHGWREDLKREGEDIEDVCAGEGPAEYSEKDKEALINPLFLSRAAQEGGQMMVARLVLRVCPHSREAVSCLSKRLAMCIQKGPVSMYYRRGPDPYEGASRALELLLSVEDEHQAIRLDAILSPASEGSLLAVLKARAEYSASNPTSYTAPSDVFRLISVLWKLYEKIPAVKLALSSIKEEWVWVAEWMHEQLTSSPYQRKSGRVATLSKICKVLGCPEFEIKRDPAILLISGAGSEEVNGMYRRAGSFNAVPKWEKRANQRCITILRISNGRASAWYITQLGFVGGKDIDYYYASCGRGDSCPPEDGWCLIKKGDGVEPCPTVKRHDDDSAAPVDDDMDTMMGGMRGLDLSGDSYDYSVAFDDQSSTDENNWM